MGTGKSLGQPHRMLGNNITILLASCFILSTDSYGPVGPKRLYSLHQCRGRLYFLVKGELN